MGCLPDEENTKDTLTHAMPEFSPKLFYFAATTLKAHRRKKIKMSLVEHLREEANTKNECINEKEERTGFQE